MKQVIGKIREENQQPRAEDRQMEPQGTRGEIDRRSEHNNARIRELQGLIASQEQVITGYKERFREFEDNLVNIMKLDKNIHERLVNSHESSGVLEANVRNVLVALNGKAPYDRLIKMI